MNDSDSHLALPDGLAARARQLEWLLLDVDGVLTDGRLWYTEEGETLKAFHVRDGMAVGLARRAGLKVGLLSGRASPVLERRAEELRLDTVLLGSRDKGADFLRFLAAEATRPAKVGFIGDDLIDLPVLLRCGLSMCPADAVHEVRAVVHHVLRENGGGGAVREAVEKILEARGAWSDVVSFFSPDPAEGG